MNIALLCIRDNCNRTSKMLRALNTVEGVTAKAYTQVTHPFNYNDPIEVGTNEQIKDLIEWSDVVWFTMGNVNLWYHFKNSLRNKNIIVTHSGTQYRQNSEKYNYIFNKFATGHILLGHDHMKLGAKNAHYNSLRIVEPTSKPKRHKGLLRIGHFPSNPNKKGTDTINAILMRLRLDGYEFISNLSTQVVSYSDNIQRMSECDVYIDQLKPLQKGINFGESGNQTYEALSLGCITVSNLTDSSYYESVHGYPIQIIANSPDELYNSLAMLIEQPRTVTERIRFDSWQMVHEQHSYKAMGLSMYNTIKEVLA